MEEQTSEDTRFGLNANTADAENTIGVSSSLQELLQCPTYQWIFVGGKGGVGKTTTSCGIAVELCKRRESVLVLSTDPAHNLSDAFGQKLSGEPTLISGFSNLYAMEIDSRFHESSGYRLTEDGVWAKLMPELVHTLPGIDEAISFTELMHAVQRMKYSVIVFDTAPTGHTLRLLGFPDVLEQGLKKIINLKSKFSGAFGMLNMVSGDAINEEELSSKLDHLKAVTTSIRQTFEDPTKTTFVCVCIAEFLSVYETERLVQELAKHNIDCSNVVVNQVLFPIVVDDNERESDTQQFEKNTDQCCADELAQLRKDNHILRRKVHALEKAHRCRRLMQSKYLRQIRDLYCEDFHVVCIPQQSREVRGEKCIREFANLLQTSSDLPVLLDDGEEE